MDQPIYKVDDGACVHSRQQVVSHNAHAIGEPFEPPDGIGFPDIKSAKQRGREHEIGHTDRHQEQGDQLARNFVNDHELRVLDFLLARNLGGSKSAGGRNQADRAQVQLRDDSV